ncbi:hypothetical protein GCW_03260 [Mycoplasmoides gallisepticum S6]|uniref:Uncharacterized protein n=1 Tax=Mycoplasmoides gallisepticum S6 TaxID=1006581 RepID=A0A0F6CLQ2_MYCGL|nr:hypothetical protein GCW_03260 [Mycoplasmoides gallisepticum S6]
MIRFKVHDNWYFNNFNLNKLSLLDVKNKLKRTTFG